jgi:hypothetical protein
MRPSKLRILGKKWAITYGPLAAKDELGECDLENQHLTVKDGLKPEQEQSTLLHECIHAISDSLGLGLTEKQVQGLETGLYDLNSSNPRFFSYLKKKYGSV